MMQYQGSANSSRRGDHRDSSSSALHKVLTFVLDVDLKKVMVVHALVCMLLGGVVIFVPHR